MSTSSRANCAERLRRAAAIVKQYAPEANGRQQCDKTDILRRLGLIVAGLERLEDAAVCRRCSRTFSFRVAWFETRGLSRPQHCDACRMARREERRHARVRPLQRTPTEQTR